MTTQIQPARAEHAPHIARLKARVWPAEDHSEAQVLRALQHPGHYTRIAVSETGDVVGFVDSFPTTGPNQRLRWEIDLLAVHPAFQGQKIGQRLIEAATQAGRAAGAAQARALVQVENSASQGALRRGGYATDGQVYRLMIASGASNEGSPMPAGAVLIPVDTMNYSGLWLEGACTPAHLAAARAECTRRGAGLVGALIHEADLTALAAAERAGFDPVESFHWWEHPYSI